VFGHQVDDELAERDDIKALAHRHAQKLFSLGTPLASYGVEPTLSNRRSGPVEHDGLSPTLSRAKRLFSEVGTNRPRRLTLMAIRGGNHVHKAGSA